MKKLIILLMFVGPVTSFAKDSRLALTVKEGSCLNNKGSKSASDNLTIETVHTEKICIYRGVTCNVEAKESTKIPQAELEAQSMHAHSRYAKTGDDSVTPGKILTKHETSEFKSDGDAICRILKEDNGKCPGFQDCQARTMHPNYLNKFNIKPEQLFKNRMKNDYKKSKRHKSLQ